MALRAANIRWARGESSVPRELLPTDQFPYHQLVDLPNATISDQEKERLKQGVEQMASVASSHLAWARENQGKVPKHARPCFLPVVPAIHYLSKLEAARYDTLDETLSQSSNLRLLLLLSRTWLTGIF
jgi:phytoene/squalene synthetase